MIREFKKKQNEYPGQMVRNGGGKKKRTSKEKGSATIEKNNSNKSFSHNSNRGKKGKMTQHYHIEIIKTKTLLKATYVNNTFKKIERLRGKISQKTLLEIGRIIPYNDQDISRLNKLHFAKINYTIQPIANKSLYTQFLDEWFYFYEDFMNVKPLFNATQGKHLKSIIVYLRSISKDNDEALHVWKLILQSWQQLDDFYRKSADLKFINSQLNKILINVKGLNKNNPSAVYESDMAKGFSFK